VRAQERQTTDRDARSLSRGSVEGPERGGLQWAKPSCITWELGLATRVCTRRVENCKVRRSLRVSDSGGQHGRLCVRSESQTVRGASSSGVRGPCGSTSDADDPSA
jgi:hypothetical protein